MAKPQYITGDKDAIKKFIDSFDVFLFDCDGVLWSGDHLFPYTVATLCLLRDTYHKQIVFVTNNSTKSRSDYAHKLNSMGIPASPEEVFGSSFSSAIWISRILPQKYPELSKAGKTKVFVLGESGVEEELRSENVEFIGGTDPAYRRDMTPEDYISICAAIEGKEGKSSLYDPSVGIVLVGLDFHINYLKLALAEAYIRYNSAIFLATNLDSTLPSSGKLFPGAGSIVAPVTESVGKPPEAFFGKPSQAMMDAIEGKYKFEDRSRVCMVGDRANTDIKFGIEGRLGGTLGVLTGVSTKEEFESGDTRPKFLVSELGDLLLVQDDK